jgi:hypothetical protein
VASHSSDLLKAEGQRRLLVAPQLDPENSIGVDIGNDRLDVHHLTDGASRSLRADMHPRQHIASCALDLAPAQSG